RQLATGPVAVVSLMTAAALEPLAASGSEGYIIYAIMLSLLVGLFQFSLGVLRLGMIVNLLSHPVVNGFTNAAAIIIASSQLSKLFGVYVDKAEHHYETIIRVIEAAFVYTHWPTLLMGILAFVIMYTLKRLLPTIPNVLVAVVITTILSQILGFENNRDIKLEALKSHSVRQTILEFNQVFIDAAPLSSRRAQFKLKLEEALKHDDTTTVLDAKFDLELMDLYNTELKYDKLRLRKKIRNVLFRRVQTPDGAELFYPDDKTPDDKNIAKLKDDGNIWRIIVGNKPLDIEKLTMMGGGQVVGAVPAGLPALRAPTFDFAVFKYLLPYAAIISLLGFMEAISIAKAMAGKTGQRIDPNQELIGQGLGNILGAIGQSYPTSGSFSRSAVNLQSGAMTGLSSVVTGIAVVIVLLFFTPLLYHLPQSVLAAVIMIAVFGLINISGFIHAWKARWYDGAISIISFGCTLAYAPHLDKGIMAGVILSLSVFFYKNMRPAVVDLSLDVHHNLRNAVASGLKECKYIDVVRFDGPLFFANAAYLEDQIRDRRRSKKGLKHIIFVCNGINDMDASGEEVLSLVVERIRSAGMDISFSGMHRDVKAVLERTHLNVKIGENHFFPTMERAINAVYIKTHRHSDEQDCPLVDVVLPANSD
ncbi:SulP family inorganic anion transporter, partial [Desulfococcaceae bacterium HSG7]|nr:SulP family inorganic anion transporter [Desulfococcaceae bacterium HSG7]